MVHKNFFRCLVLTLSISLFFQIPGFLFAQQAGPGPGGAQGATALTTFQTNDFSGSGVCASCHSGLTDEAMPTPKDVSMDAHWRSTMMANAAKDPLWQAKISAEVALVPPDLGLEQLIQEKCSRCHMGMARYQQLADGASEEDIYVLDTGFLDPNHGLHEAAMDGVSCTLCHQVQPDKLGTLYSFTGKYVIDTSTSPPDRLIFGPYDQVLQNPMQQSIGFLPVLEDLNKHHLTSSAHCGSCHTLYTPTLDAGGTPVGEFPEQTTYLEWEHSQFNNNKTCQDCHLPDAVGSVVISNRPRRLEARTPFGQHHYVGGNSFMVNLLKTKAGVLGVTAEDAHLDATILRTQNQLQDITAIVTATASLEDDQLEVVVNVENLAGHKFPSGIPLRRAWLHMTVADAGGNIFFESGEPLAEGKIDGNNADMDLTDFEPHYDTITSSDQVQIYETVMKNTDGEVTYTLLRANEYAKDNRLLPAGFDKGTAADTDIGVYGDAKTDDDFIGGSDQIVYDVDVSSAQGAKLTVTVELLFQALSYPFVADLENTPTPLVQSFMGLYNPADNVPLVVVAIPPITVR